MRLVAIVVFGFLPLAVACSHGGAASSSARRRSTLGRGWSTVQLRHEARSLTKQEGMLPASATKIARCEAGIVTPSENKSSAVLSEAAFSACAKRYPAEYPYMPKCAGAFNLYVGHGYTPPKQVADYAQVSGENLAMGDFFCNVVLVWQVGQEQTTAESFSYSSLVGTWTRGETETFPAHVDIKTNATVDESGFVHQQ
jgi:hypothetical protein